MQMPKKVIIPVLIAVGVLLIAGGVLFTLGRSEKKEEGVISPGLIEEEAQPTTTAPETLIWKDPAGFSFSYPSGVKINNHPEDKINYANLELTLSGKTGSIKILASDTKLKKIADWEKGQLKFSAKTLGGKEAKEITLNIGKTTVGMIDSNILFTVEMTPEDENTLWQSTYEEVVSSFELWEPTPAQSSNAGSSQETSGGDVVEEEEVIE